MAKKVKNKIKLEFITEKKKCFHARFRLESQFFYLKKMGKKMGKNTFIFATLIIGEIIAFDCVGSYCQQQGKSKEDKWGNRF